MTPVVDVQTLVREVARKLKAQLTDGGDGTLLLETGDCRVSRKLTLGQSAVQYVNNRNRRTFTAFKGPSGHGHALHPRGVAIFSVDSVMAPLALRNEAWTRLAPYLDPC